MSRENLECARRDVVSIGYEAHCIEADGTCWLWHNGCGLRVEAHGPATTLITDPALLPNGPWVLTELGEQELHDGELWT